jgi:hypothetical protein
VEESVLPSLPVTVPAGAQRSLVPAYFYPSEADVSGVNWWPRMCVGARGGSIAIMNPGDGPGTAFDQNYKNAIDLCHGQDWKVIGYVKTSWGKRSEKQVREDIDKYRSWYPWLRLVGRRGVRYGGPVGCVIPHGRGSRGHTPLGLGFES